MPARSRIDSMAAKPASANSALTASAWSYPCSTSSAPPAPSRGDAQRGFARVGCDDVRLAPFARQCDRNRARTGAEIEDAGGAVVRKVGERALDEHFGFGTRDHHVGRHDERQSPELAQAREIGNR